MFSVTILTVGKLKEPFYGAACAEYLKRLRGLCRCELIELPESRLPEQPTAAELQAGLLREAEEIRKHIPKGSVFCVCTPEGELLSSEELAERLRKIKLSGKSSLCVLIGGSFGIEESLKKEAELRISFSRMTFPHHLFRVMLLEQLYRAETIQAGIRYHK